MPRDRDQIIIAVVGMAGSGKSLACDFFKTKGYPVLRFGDETDRGLRAKNLPLTETNERQYRENLRKELGMAAYAIKLEPRIKETFHSGVECIVLDGLYSWEEYTYLKAKFPQLKLLGIYARPEIRYQRLENRPVRPLTEIQAKQRDCDELKHLNKAEPIALADYLIVNETSVSAFHQELEKALNFFLLD
ncbi:MAG: AAA family ATPase [Candidatus Beckwithbacteria bacterium]|nr:AAA family ATPase [Candidatus Beckwithbacteria bacterium]